MLLLFMPRTDCLKNGQLRFLLFLLFSFWRFFLQNVALKSGDFSSCVFYVFLNLLKAFRARIYFYFHAVTRLLREKIGVIKGENRGY